MTLAVSEEVRAAVADASPVVALETSVLAHGLPEPENREAARRMEEALRDAGAVPAWTWIEDGAVRVGASPGELEALMVDETAKVGRRDLPVALAMSRSGATTVSAMIWAARAAGIEVAATGGIGGVHPGTGDVSADLLELARTPVTLVCSGPKSILDPAATLERLDELGVVVIGYRCDRLPFFVVRDAGLPLEHRADRPHDVGAVIRTRSALALDSAILVCNPVPEEAALPAAEVAAAVEDCEAEAADVVGKALTPRLLRCLAEKTEGRSVDANLALLESNARVAAEIASVVGRAG